VQRNQQPFPGGDPREVVRLQGVSPEFPKGRGRNPRDGVVRRSQQAATPLELPDFEAVRRALQSLR